MSKATAPVYDAATAVAAEVEGGYVGKAPITYIKSRKRFKGEIGLPKLEGQSNERWTTHFMCSNRTVHPFKFPHFYKYSSIWAARGLKGFHPAP